MAKLHLDYVKNIAQLLVSETVICLNCFLICGNVVKRKNFSVQLQICVCFQLSQKNVLSVSRNKEMFAKPLVFNFALKEKNSN